MPCRAAILAILCMTFATCLPIDEGTNDSGLYVNEWAVKVAGGQRVARSVAEDNGFEFDGQIGNLPDTYAFIQKQVSTRSRRAADDVHSLLEKDERVTWAEQQQIIIHSKKTVDVLPPDETGDDWAIPYNDPLWPKQWYLYNDGQSGAVPGMDMNLMPAWKLGYTGKGTVVSIVDDGMDQNHPDLKDNFDKYASFDFNDRSNGHSPTPDYSKPASMIRHGTRCAGEVAAAANNSICGVGVSYEASIGGIRLLDGPVTDRLTAEAIQFNNSHIDIYSCCWGPVDNGRTFEMPPRLTREAFAEGARTGRNGKGSIFVWAAGNGGDENDHCGADGYVGDIHTIAISSVNDQGQVSYFSESCAAIMAVTLSGGPADLSEIYDHKFQYNLVSTTDLYGNCTSSFVGTSSAAPLASGIFAIILQANPELTWRDLQYIITEGCKIPQPYDDGWRINGAGLHVHHLFGFGMLDAGRMVEMALQWEPVGPQQVCELDPVYPEVTVQQGEARNVTLVVTCSKITSLEHVKLVVSFEARRRGDVSVDLFSPSGTPSQLLAPRIHDSSEEGAKSWPFMTVHNWGEDPNGEWILQIGNNPTPAGAEQSADQELNLVPRLRAKTVTLESVGMILYGLEEAREIPEDDVSTKKDDEDDEDNPAVNPEDAGKGDHNTIVKIYNQEQLDNEEIHIHPEDIAAGLPNPPNMAHNIDTLTGAISTNFFDGQLLNRYVRMMNLVDLAKRMEADPEDMLRYLDTLDDPSLELLTRELGLEDDFDTMQATEREEEGPSGYAKKEKLLDSDVNSLRAATREQQGPSGMEKKQRFLDGYQGVVAREEETGRNQEKTESRGADLSDADITSILRSLDVDTLRLLIRELELMDGRHIEQWKRDVGEEDIERKDADVQLELQKKGGDDLFDSLDREISQKVWWMEVEDDRLKSTDVEVEYEKKNGEDLLEGLKLRGSNENYDKKLQNTDQIAEQSAPKGYTREEMELEMVLRDFVEKYDNA